MDNTKYYVVKKKSSAGGAHKGCRDKETARNQTWNDDSGSDRRDRYQQKFFL